MCQPQGEWSAWVGLLGFRARTPSAGACVRRGPSQRLDSCTFEGGTRLRKGHASGTLRRRGLLAMRTA